MGSSSGMVKPNTKIGICCFSTKHTALSSKNKYCLALNQDKVSELSNMYTHGLLIQ